MTGIYDQHRASFSNVSAYVVMKDGKRVATAAFKFPKDGAGRLQCYLHVLGFEMVRGFASGGGYDKVTASAEHAVLRLTLHDDSRFAENIEDGKAIKTALLDCKSWDWTRCLTNAGFEVLQAV